MCASNRAGGIPADFSIILQRNFHLDSVSMFASNRAGGIPADFSIILQRNFHLDSVSMFASNRAGGIPADFSISTEKLSFGFCLDVCVKQSRWHPC